jgi:hypothetical protein
MKPLFYVLKSTKYFNPISKMRVPVNKKERVDPTMYTHVSLEDQQKVYRMFGFQGHVGPKKSNEDGYRDELLCKIKAILYEPATLTTLILHLMQRSCIEVDVVEVRRICEGLRLRSDYDVRAYGLPEKWFHDATWIKLRYVCGEGQWANFGGGDGQLDRTITDMAATESKYIK